MASAAIFIEKRAYSDGLVPIFLRITVSRKIHLKQLCKVPEANIDRKKKEIRKAERGYIQLNLLITRSLQDAKEYILDCNLRKVPVDPDHFFGITDQSGTISAHITALADRMKRSPDSYFTGRKYAAVASKIKRLGLDTNIRLINKEWIKRLDTALEGIGNKPLTRRKDMGVISATITAAGLPNPFAGYKKPGGGSPKNALTRAEFDRISTVDLPADLHIYRQAFIFAIMARGMRKFDLLTLQWSAIDGGRLVYVPDKTRKKEKVVDMIISEPMRAILDEVAGKGPYVFPINKSPPEVRLTNPVAYKGRVNRAAYRMNAALKEIAALAGISKHITIHVARHTFAYLADKNGIALGDIQRLLNHGSIEVTAGYLRSLRAKDELDEATEGLF